MLITALGLLEGRDGLVLASKTCTEELWRLAVVLYETTPGATVRGIAEDLGITRGALRQ